MRGGLTPSHWWGSGIGVILSPSNAFGVAELGVAEFMVKTLALPTFGNAHPISLILANTLMCNVQGQHPILKALLHTLVICEVCWMHQHFCFGH